MTSLRWTSRDLESLPENGKRYEIIDNEPISPEDGLSSDLSCNVVVYLAIKRRWTMGPKLPRITAAELLRALRRNDWQPARQSGSHVTLKHPTKPGCVVVSRHPGVTLKPKTLATILKQAGLTVDDLKRLL